MLTYFLRWYAEESSESVEFQDGTCRFSELASSDDLLRAMERLEDL